MRGGLKSYLVAGIGAGRVPAEDDYWDYCRRERERQRVRERDSLKTI